MNKKMQSMVIGLFLACNPFLNLFSAELSTPKIERRAAFKFESQKIELHIADVDISKNKVVSSVFDKVENFPYTRDLESQMIQSVEKLVNEAKKYSPNVTKGFIRDLNRETEETKKLFQKIHERGDLQVIVLTEEQESIVEFISAVNTIQTNPSNVITLNLSLGTLSLTAQCDNEYFVWIKKFDLFSRILRLMEGKGDNQFPPIPLSRNEAKKEILYVKDSIKDLPLCIHNKVANSNTIIVDIDKFPHFKMGSGKVYNRTQLQEEIQRRTETWDKVVNAEDGRIYPAAAIKNVYGFALADLILAFGVMDELDIHEIEMATVKDPMVGLLLYPKFWSK